MNLVLLGGLIFFLTNRRKQEPRPRRSYPKPDRRCRRRPPCSSGTSDTEPAPFRWSQLMSAKDYGLYIANLRAIGCPEATIEDIVRGDTDRAFSWERSQLGLDGSGAGPWSRSREMQLVASLLGGQPPVGTTTLAQSTENPTEGTTAVRLPKPPCRPRVRRQDHLPTRYFFKIRTGAPWASLPTAGGDCPGAPAVPERDWQSESKSRRRGEPECERSQQRWQPVKPQPQ